MKNIKKISLILALSIILSLLSLLLTGCDKNNYNSNMITNNIDEVGESKSYFTVGEYSIQVDNSILKEDDPVGDESIEFLDNNKFNSYIGFGNGISGTYTVSNNEINCTADTFYSEYGPQQKINASIYFKINSDSEIEIIDTTESYKIKVVDILNNTLTDETKDMSLWPFINGVKFILTK